MEENCLESVSTDVASDFEEGLKKVASLCMSDLRIHWGSSSCVMKMYFSMNGGQQVFFVEGQDSGSTDFSAKTPALTQQPDETQIWGSRTGFF